MAAPPRFTTLRESDLSIKDGPVDGASLRDIFKRFFAQMNPSLDRTNTLTAKGVTLGENIRCDVVTVKATHATPLTVKLQTLKRANSCLVTGGDTLLPHGVAAVQMLQPAQTGGGINAAQVTVYFQAGSGTANVRLWLFEDGQQATQTLTFDAQQEAWNTPTLINGFANFGAPFLLAGYMKDTLGFVHLRGLIANAGAEADGAVAFVLPAGYRPSATVRAGAAFGSYVDVDSSGNVAIRPATGAVSNRALDGITFDTR